MVRLSPAMTPKTALPPSTSLPPSPSAHHCNLPCEEAVFDCLSEVRFSSPAGTAAMAMRSKAERRTKFVVFDFVRGKIYGEVASLHQHFFWLKRFDNSQ